jgi:hypothetical protein
LPHTVYFYFPISASFSIYILCSVCVCRPVSRRGFSTIANSAQVDVDRPFEAGRGQSLSPPLTGVSLHLGLMLFLSYVFQKSVLCLEHCARGKRTVSLHDVYGFFSRARTLLYRSAPPPSSLPNCFAPVLEISQFQKPLRLPCKHITPKTLVGPQAPGETRRLTAFNFCINRSTERGSLHSARGVGQPPASPVESSSSGEERARARGASRGGKGRIPTPRARAPAPPARKHTPNTPFFTA